MATHLSAELLFEIPAELGEGPVWDSARGTLHWVDITGRQFHSLQLSNREHSVVQLDQMIGAAILRARGGWILCLKNGFHSFVAETREWVAIADPESHLPRNRFNDAKCDPGGRLLAGTMPTNCEGTSGSLYRLDPDLSVTKLIDGGLGCSNGLSWSVDGKTLYFIDTPTRRVDAFDYDLESGSVSNRRTAFHFPEQPGMPDGMAADAEGMLWIAEWGGARVGRWDPRKGECLGAIEVPARQVTSCAFGGPALDELFITTARIGCDADSLERYPNSGCVFRARPGVPGMPVAPFAG